MKNFLPLTLALASIYLLTNFFRGEIINAYSTLTAGASKLEIENAFLKEENVRLSVLLQSKSVSHVGAASQDLIETSSGIFDKTNFLYNDIVLNKGSIDGVEVGAMVYATGKRPAGTIKRVYEKSSVLELFSSHKNTRDALLITATTTTHVTVIGDGTSGMYARALDNLEVTVGDRVYLKGYESASVGTIVSIKNLESDNEKVMYIRPSFDRNVESIFYVQK